MIVRGHAVGLRHPILANQYVLTVGPAFTGHLKQIKVAAREQVVLLAVDYRFGGGYCRRQVHCRVAVAVKLCPRSFKQGHPRFKRQRSRVAYPAIIGGAEGRGCGQFCGCEVEV